MAKNRYRVARPRPQTDWASLVGSAIVAGVIAAAILSTTNLPWDTNGAGVVKTSLRVR